MESDNYNNDRRRQFRVRVEFILTYTIDQPLDIKMLVGNKEVNALMFDLSPKGMALVTDYDIPTSTILCIKFTLINLKAEGENRISSIHVTGVVRNNKFIKRRQYRLGISFSRISITDQSAITDFIRQARIS